ncbi:MAG TPA: hypothetical protein VKN14_03900 [Flavobacteriaceae bacterium]|nr:hypothetical protein [Flavobacteriaceae bacterium]
MTLINRYSKFIPYIYFIAIISYWFTDVNRTAGLSAFPILLIGIPFLWQILKPNRSFNFILGTVFVCLSSYLILAYLVQIMNLATFTTPHKFVLFGGLFIFLNFIMAIWIVRNSLKRSF